jgi:predicted RNA-binding protein
MVIEGIRTDASYGSKYNTPGKQQVNWMKLACDSARLNLLPFFEKAGMLKPINAYIEDYTPGWIVISDAMIANLKNHVREQGYPTPKEEINYINAHNFHIYRDKLALEVPAEYGYGCTPPKSGNGVPTGTIRVEHAKVISDMNLDGYAIGGLAVGESHEDMYRIIEATVPFLPEDKPTYLMGVGTPANILEAVDRGVDFFDCVYPSRNGRHGHVYTNQGKLNLFNAKYELDEKPIEEGCQCPACRSYSRSYIRHLFKARELLGMRLCVLHNLYFYNDLMEKIRTALDEGRFEQFYNENIEILESRLQD